MKEGNMFFEKEYLKAKLTPLEYKVTQEGKTEDPYTSKYEIMKTNIITGMKMEIMFVLFAAIFFLNQTTSMIVEVDGQPSTMKHKMEMLQRLRISALEELKQK